MEYTQLDITTMKYDQLAETIYHRQIEHFQYKSLIDNLTAISAVVDGDRKVSIDQQIAANQEQMELVELYYQASLTQITDQAEFDAAVIRYAAKRAASTTTE